MFSVTPVQSTSSQVSEGWGSRRSAHPQPVLTGRAHAAAGSPRLGGGLSPGSEPVYSGLSAGASQCVGSRLESARRSTAAPPVASGRLRGPRPQHIQSGAAVQRTPSPTVRGSRVTSRRGRPRRTTTGATGRCLRARRRTVGRDRTPPQDMAAEQSVLGAMLISKDAIAKVLEVGPRRRTTTGPRTRRSTTRSSTCTAAASRSTWSPSPASSQRRGELQRIGGAPYLHTLAANVPIAANAGYYAEIVREKAMLRRLVDAGTKIVQIGYAGEGEVDDIVDAAQAEVYGVTDRRKAEDYAPLSRHHGRRPRRDRGDRATGRPASTACPPASPTSTSSPTASTQGR